MIHNIVAGGEDVAHDIYLREVDIGTNGALTGGVAQKGDVTFDGKGAAMYPFNGRWSGQFYNGTADDGTTDVDESLVAPGSVAGTFGVTMADNAMTEDVNEQTSFVGAFGAHIVE